MSEYPLLGRAVFLMSPGVTTLADALDSDQLLSLTRNGPGDYTIETVDERPRQNTRIDTSVQALIELPPPTIVSFRHLQGFILGPKFWRFVCYNDTFDLSDGAIVEINLWRAPART